VKETDMPGYKGETYLYTAEEKISDLLQQDYGPERGEKEEDLRELVAAVRRDWAAKLRKLRDEQYGPSTFKAERNAIDLALNEIDPDTPDTA
jgi:hypothetical protein